MLYCENIKIEQNDIDDCFYELNICDNVLECVCCCFFLEKHKKNIVEETLENCGELPKEITRIKIPILPHPANKPLYSFNGIEAIIYKLFKTDDTKLRTSLENKKAFLKVYYEKNSLFNLPIIKIEIIFFGRLHSKTSDKLWKSLKSDVLSLTGSVGEIDEVDVINKFHLTELLNIPILFGYPEFKLQGILLDNNYTLDQIAEMNYLHSSSLQHLKMKHVINKNTLELFKDQRYCIKKEKLEKELDIENLNDEEINDLIHSVFPETTKDGNRDLEDNLPF